jgi:hypothetical protein
MSDSIESSALDEKNKDIEALTQKLMLSANMGKQLLVRLEASIEESKLLNETIWQLESDKAYYEKLNLELSQEVNSLRHENLNLSITNENHNPNSDKNKPGNYNNILEEYNTIIFKKNEEINEYLTQIEFFKNENMNLLEQLSEIKLESDALTHRLQSSPSGSKLYDLDNENPIISPIQTNSILNLQPLFKSRQSIESITTDDNNDNNDETATIMPTFLSPTIEKYQSRRSSFGHNTKNILSEMNSIKLDLISKEKIITLLNVIIYIYIYIIE